MFNQSTEDLKHIAIYYPSLMGLHQVKVLGSSFLSSNDWGAYCPEMRHFIDLSALLSLDGGREMLEEMVECDPPVSIISGRRMSDQRVIGMLKGPLKLTYKVRGGEDMGKKVNLWLEHILVVDKLPVPLHISFKLIEARSKDPGIYMFLNDSNGRVAFEVENLPAEYRSHPYYIDDETIFFPGIDGTQHIELRSHFAERLSDIGPLSPTVRIQSCAHCGAASSDEICLKKCGSCLTTLYCSRKHQKDDWPRHKLVCIACS